MCQGRNTRMGFTSDADFKGIICVGFFGISLSQTWVIVFPFFHLL
jgi:hypothetical protein